MNIKDHFVNLIKNSLELGLLIVTTAIFAVVLASIGIPEDRIDFPAGALFGILLGEHVYEKLTNFVFKKYNICQVNLKGGEE